MKKEYELTAGRLLLLALGVGLLSACASDDGVVSPEHDASDDDCRQVTYSLRPQTIRRASVVEEGLAFRWDKGDRLTVWKGAAAESARPVTFETSEGGIGTALFQHTGPVTASQVYFGFYPAVDAPVSREIKIEIPDRGIRQNEASSSLHLKDFRPMYTTVVAREESTTELTGMTFRHLTALLVFRVKNFNEETALVREISVEAGRPVFYTEARYEAGSGAGQAVPSEASAVRSVRLSLGDDGICLSPDEELKAFLPVLPTTDLMGTDLSVSIRTDSHFYAPLTLSGTDVGDRDQNGVCDFAPSYYYQFRLELKNRMLEWGDRHIESWKEGEVTEIPV